LTLFDGDASEAFDALNEPDVSPRRSEFTPLRVLLEDDFELCDDAGIQGNDRHPPLAASDLFQALFAPKSDFTRRFHERRGDRNVQYKLVRPSSGMPFGAWGTLRCTVPVQVLGLCPYYEAQRFVLCRQGGKRTLVLHQVGTIHAGRLYGDIVSETIFFFSEPADGAMVRLRAIAKRPQGRFVGMAIDGLKKALSDFRATVEEVLQELDLPLTPRRQAGASPEASDTLATVGKTPLGVPAPRLPRQEFPCLECCWAGLRPVIGRSSFFT